jgi:hypothetical protein
MKTKLFFTVVVLCTIFAFCGCVSSDSDFALPVVFTIVNKTGQPLEELYCSPAFAHFQSTELFGGVVLENGQSRELSFMPEFAAPYFDICAVDIDGNEYLATGISPAKTSIVTLFDDQYESDDNFPEFSDFSLDTPE